MCGHCKNFQTGKAASLKVKMELITVVMLLLILTMTVIMMVVVMAVNVVATVNSQKMTGGQLSPPHIY